MAARLERREFARHYWSMNTPWTPTPPSETERRERDDAAELLLTELRRGLALISGTFNNDQSRKRACLEAARARDAVRELMAQVPVDEAQKARVERGLDTLVVRIETFARSDGTSSG
jgi:hypothetical protein